MGGLAQPEFMRMDRASAIPLHVKRHGTVQLDGTSAVGHAGSSPLKRGGVQSVGSGYSTR